MLRMIICPEFSIAQISIEEFPDRYFSAVPEFSIPPGIDPSNELLKDGYIDVTLYGALPDDGIDDTDEIQQAIFDSYIYSYAVYFPSGTYNVSKTLNCMTPTFIGGKEEVLSQIRPGHVLVGSSTGPRPVIKLDDNCPGFQDASIVQYKTAGSNPETVSQYTTLRAVINFWRQGRKGGGSVERELNTGNVNFNQTIRGIDIDCGTGNPGAVGLWMQGAEGTTCQDVKIIAYGAFAGMYDLMGSGGSATNLEIYGGKYGIYAYNLRPIPVITGLKLYDQTEACFYVGDFTPIVFVGFDFRKETGPVFEFKVPWHPCQGNLSLIDGKIELTEGDQENIMIPNAVTDNKERMLYLKNVYVKGAGTIIYHRVSKRYLQVQDYSQWAKIEEYQYNRNYSQAVKLVDGILSKKSTWYNGILSDNNIMVDSFQEPPDDLITKHLWLKGLANFDYDTTNVLNVMDFGAVPEDETYDHEAFQLAIDSAAKCNPVKRVFIPRGHYLINHTIDLPSGVELFGVARHLSILQPKDWKESQETPVIKTENSRNSSTKIANFKIELYHSQNQIYAIDWQAGEHSIVKDVWIYWMSWSDPDIQDTNQALRRVRIRNNGGGRWYNQLGMSGHGSRNNKSRHILIEGSSNPLTFYGFHNQYLETLNGPMSEIRDASNVTIYSLKTETASERQNFPEGQWSTSILIKDSKNIFLSGMSGNAQTESGKGLIEIENSENVTISNMGTWINNAEYPFDTWYLVKENLIDHIEGIPMSLKVMGLYKTGNSRKIYRVPNEYNSLVPALEAVKSDSLVSHGIILVDEGEYLESTVFNADLKRKLKIEVKGDGADKTIIKGTDDDKVLPGFRLINADFLNTEKLDLTFKNISFKRFGFDGALDKKGGLFLSGNSPVSYSFTNCNITNNSAASASVLNIANPASAIEFYNCFIGNNTVGPGQGESINGAIEVRGGTFVVENSVFMSNHIYHPVGSIYQEGNSSCISADNLQGETNLTFTSNAFVNNKSLSENQIATVLSVYKAGNNAYPINLNLIDNIMVGNRNSNYPKDADIRIENDFVSSTGSGNVINKLLINDENHLQKDGFFIDSLLGYTGDTLEFIMDGELPALFTDDHGVNYLKYDYIEPPASPEIVTAAIVMIRDNFAISGGLLSNIENIEVSSYGLCWDTLPKPTIENDTTFYVYKTASFESKLTDLLPNTTYYVRAYFNSNIGTFYGQELSFQTTNFSNTATISNFPRPEFFSYQGCLHGINLERGNVLKIYNIRGSVIGLYRLEMDHLKIPLEKGIYIVQYNDLVKKIIIQ